MYYLLCLFKASSTHAYTHLVLQNRVWQRDSRDIPVIQPDATYFNEVRQNQIFLALHLSFMSSQTFPLCSVTVGKIREKNPERFCYVNDIEGRQSWEKVWRTWDNIHMMNLFILAFCFCTLSAVMKQTAWEQGKSII